MNPVKFLPRTEDHERDLKTFVATLYEPDDWIEIRLLPESTEGYVKKDWVQAKCLGSKDEELHYHNHFGYGIFFGVAPRIAFGESRDAGVLLSRVAWTDFDHTTPEDAMKRWSDAGLPEPSLVVGSGNGAHIYGRLDSPLAPDEVKSLNKKLAKVLGSDPAVVNAGRIMRVPGSYNMKDRSNPKLVRIIEKDGYNG